MQPVLRTNRLTAKQEALYIHLAQWMLKNEGRLPSHRTIMRHFGWSSVASVQTHAFYLYKKGVICYYESGPGWYLNDVEVAVCDGEPILITHTEGIANLLRRNKLPVILHATA